MKQRIISAIVALIIVVPLIIIGGNPYKIAVITIGTIGLLEIIKAKKSVKKLPLLVEIITVFNFLMFILSNISVNDFSLVISFKFIVLNIVSLLLPIVLYHYKNKYNIEDAMFLMSANIFLSVSFSLLMTIRIYSVNLLIFILLITFLTDIFAYLVGLLIGKHKFSPTISPNKTVEGFVGGIVFGTFITSFLYITVFDYTGNVIILVIIMSFLSMMSTLGDLAFSSIKRYFNIKDFGNIMPGHGGVLDRLDSLIFVLLTFYLIANYL